MGKSVEKKEKARKAKCKGYADKSAICKNERIKNNFPLCRNCAGKKFEDEVSKVFRIQGYDVNENIRISSTQNDFLATLKYGFAHLKILVECKWKLDVEETVNGQDVRKFHGSFTVFNEDGLFGRADKAFIVTNADFAPEAREVAKRLNIELFAFSELLNSLINFEPYQNLLIKQFEESELSKHYIELRSNSYLEYYEDNDELAVCEEGLTQEILDLFELRGEDAIVLLGDYGTGKTSFCMKLAHTLCSRILDEREQALMPFIIQLRDYTTAPDMSHLITNMLINKLRIVNGNFDTFMELLENGHFLLIFDGFDEVARRVDQYTKYKVFSEICKFASSNSKVLVTCRPNFFNDRDEFEKIFKASPLHFEPLQKTVPFYEVKLAPLNYGQIVSYIHSFSDKLRGKGYSPDEFLTLIQSIHDLMDLAKRPVLLNIIVETIPQLPERESFKVNAASLYNVYTGYWINREESKGKSLLKSSEKIRFSQELAWSMFQKNVYEISYIQLPSAVKQYIHVDSNEDLDYFSHDVKSCSFLNRDDVGNYRFIHKSFMEFFVAQKLIDSLDEASKQSINSQRKTFFLNNLLEGIWLNAEVGLFFRDLLEIDNSVKNNIYKYLLGIKYMSLDIHACANYLSLLSKFEHDMSSILSNLKPIHFTHLDLSFCKISNTIFDGKDFSGVSLMNSQIEKVDFNECNLVDSNFKGAKIKDSHFVAANLDAVDFTNANIKDSYLSRTSMAVSKWSGSVWDSVKFDSCDLSDMRFFEDAVIRDCTGIDTCIGVPYSI